MEVQSHEKWDIYESDIMSINIVSYMHRAHIASYPSEIVIE